MEKQRVYLRDLVVDGYNLFWKQLFTNVYYSFVIIFGGRNSAKSENAFRLLLLRLEKEPNSDAIIFRKYGNVHNNSSVNIIAEIIDQLSKFWPNMSNWTFKGHELVFTRYIPSINRTQKITLLGMDTGAATKTKSWKVKNGYISTVLWDEVQDPDDLQKKKIISSIEKEKDSANFRRITKSIFRRGRKFKKYPNTSFLLVTNNEMSHHWTQDEFYNPYIKATDDEMIKVGEHWVEVDDFSTVDFGSGTSKRVIKLNALIGQTCVKLIENNDNLEILDDQMIADLEKEKERGWENYRNVVLGFPPLLKFAKFNDFSSLVKMYEYSYEDFKALYPLDIAIDYGSRDETAMALWATTVDTSHDNLNVKTPNFEKLYMVASRKWEGLIDSKGIKNKEDRKNLIAKQIAETIFSWSQDYRFVHQHGVRLTFKPDFFWLAAPITKELEKIEDTNSITHGENYFSFLSIVDDTSNFKPRWHNPHVYSVFYNFAKEGRIFINVNTDYDFIYDFEKLQKKPTSEKIQEIEDGQDRIEANIYSSLPYWDHFLDSNEI